MVIFQWVGTSWLERWKPSKGLKLNVKGVKFCKSWQRDILYLYAELNTDFFAWRYDFTVFLLSRAVVNTFVSIPYRALVFSLLLKVTRTKPFISRDLAEKPSAGSTHLDLKLIVWYRWIQQEQQSSAALCISPSWSTFRVIRLKCAGEFSCTRRQPPRL